MKKKKKSVPLKNDETISSSLKQLHYQQQFAGRMKSCIFSP
jgi:hypothetical protein